MVQPLARTRSKQPQLTKGKGAYERAVKRGQVPNRGGGRLADAGQSGRSERGTGENQPGKPPASGRTVGALAGLCHRGMVGSGVDCVEGAVRSVAGFARGVDLPGEHGAKISWHARGARTSGERAKEIWRSPGRPLQPRM